MATRRRNKSVDAEAPFITNTVETQEEATKEEAPKQPRRQRQVKPKLHFAFWIDTVEVTRDGEAVGFKNETFLSPLFNTKEEAIEWFKSDECPQGVEVRFATTSPSGAIKSTKTQVVIEGEL